MLPEKTLLNQAKTNPNKIALVDKGVSYSYQEIYTKALQLSIQLLEQASDCPVALFFEPSVEGIISIYACLLTGMIFVPFSPQSALETMITIIDQVGSEIILTTDQLAENLQTFQRKILIVNQHSDNQSDQDRQLIQKKQTTTDVGAIFFTSGSTGKAKGVITPKSGWSQMVETWEKELRISQYEHFLVLSGFNFTGFVDDMFMCFFVGGTMHLCSPSYKSNIRKLVEYIEENQIDFLDFTPAYVRQLNRLAEKQNLSFTPPPLVIVGSEAWLVEDMLKIRKSLPEATIINSYGLTEGVVDNGIFFATDIENRELTREELVPIGKPFGDTEFIVLDEFNQQVNQGEIGELCVASNGLALGYFANTGANNFDSFGGKRIVRTGDMVVQTNDGITKLIGRKDDVTKIHGKRIDLKQIEQIAYEFEQVKDCAVIISHHNGIRSVVCFLALYDCESSQLELEILTKIQKIIELPTIPFQCIQVPKIPRKPDGKTDIASLRQLCGQNQKVDILSTADDSIVSDIFRSHLDDEFNPNVDIFLHGADSLTLELINFDLEEKLGLTIPLEVFYQARTLKKISESIRNVKPKPQTDRRTVATLDYKISDLARLNQANQVLETEIRPLVMSNVLLTGSTGFLGIHILNQLLSSAEQIYCLVRGESEIAKQRLVNHWQTHFSKPFPADRVVILPGNFAKPDLGLSAVDLETAFKNVDGVIHAGYWVNFLLDYFSQEEINVRGLEHMLRFSAQASNAPFIFISSSSTSLIHSTDLLSEHDGYELTKYVCEIMVKDHVKQGYQAATIAPALISPSLTQTIFPSKDFFWSFVDASLKTGSLPDIDWLVELVPVDELAQIICSGQHLVNQKAVITNRQPLNISDIQAELQQVTENKINLLPFQTWLQQLRQYLKIHPNLAIHPFLSGLEQKGTLFFDCGKTIYSPHEKVIFSEKPGKLLLAQYLEAKKLPHA